MRDPIETNRRLQDDEGSWRRGWPEAEQQTPGWLRTRHTAQRFAHVGGRGWTGRGHFLGLIDGGKRYLMYVVARSLGVMMRVLVNMGAPRALQTERGGFSLRGCGGLRRRVPA